MIIKSYLLGIDLVRFLCLGLRPKYLAWHLRCKHSTTWINSQRYCNDKWIMNNYLMLLQHSVVLCHMMTGTFLMPFNIHRLNLSCIYTYIEPNFITPLATRIEILNCKQFTNQHLLNNTAVLMQQIQTPAGHHLVWCWRNPVLILGYPSTMSKKFL